MSFLLLVMNGFADPGINNLEAQKNGATTWDELQ